MQIINLSPSHSVSVPDDSVIGGTVDDSRITKLAFRQRFTFAEKVEVETAAETNAGIRVMLKDQEAANFIDLSRQDTIDGVNYLTTVMRQDGITPLISTQRASEILTNPIQPVERP